MQKANLLTFSQFCGKLEYVKKGEIMVDEKKCIACGACISICPVGAIRFVNGKAYINPKKCIKCNSCAQFCPVVAIDINTEDPITTDNSKKTDKKKL